MPVSGGLYKKDSPICMWKHQELRRKEKDCTALVRCEDLSTFYGPRKTRDTRLVPKAKRATLSTLKKTVQQPTSLHSLCRALLSWGLLLHLYIEPEHPKINTNTAP